MRHLRVMFSLALLTLWSVGCNANFDGLTGVLGVGGTPASIVVTVPASLTVGEAGKAFAVVKDSDGVIITDLPVTWGSTAPAVATISPNGAITAVSAGSATITASIAGSTVTGQGTVSVAPGATPSFPPTTPAAGIDLPQSSVATTMPAAPAAGGTVISVPTGGDLQAALNQARGGDVIELAAGATFRGHFVLPNRVNDDGWVVIRPTADVVLPPAGTRLTKTLAAALRLPQIVSPDGAPAISTAPSAHHYRLVGLEVTLDPAVTQSYGLIALGTDAPGGQRSLDVVPHHLVLDRLYIHGHAGQALRRGVALNSAWTAIIESSITECHENSADAQAILGWNGPGPYRIENNYLESGGEVIMFGGSDPGIPNMVPSDIEVRRNHLTHPLAWQGVWQVKNLFELKNARRVLVEGNVMENNWPNAQDGTAIVLKSVNQENTAPWSGTSHVTFRLNVIRNVKNAFTLAAHPEAPPVDPAHSMSISDNLISNIGFPAFGGATRGVLTQGDLADISFVHNTMVSDEGMVDLYMGPAGAKLTRFDYMNNAFSGGHGMMGDNMAPGTDSWTAYVASGRVVGNVFAGTGGTGLTYPTGNFFPADVAGIGFVNSTAADFHLAPTSPFKGKASDGRDPGADMDAVLAATRGVVIP